LFVPGDRGTVGKDKDKKGKHPLQKFAHILVRGGRAKDLPGVRYTAICGKLDLPMLERRLHGRSKFGVPLKRKEDLVLQYRYQKFRYN